MLQKRPGMGLQQPSAGRKPVARLRCLSIGSVRAVVLVPVSTGQEPVRAALVCGGNKISSEVSVFVRSSQEEPSNRRENELATPGSGNHERR